VTGLRVLCWGHRRAVDPMHAVQAAFARVRPDVTLAIDVRSLADFEHQGMAEVARRYDVIVFDHPFGGDIVAQGLFVPLDEAFPALLGPAADSLYAGPSLASYRIGGHVWGAPIDAATPHANLRADLLERVGEAVPGSWGDAERLGARLRAKGLWLGLAVHTPHALMTIGSLMANAGRPWGTDPAQPLTVDADAFCDAYDAVQRLLAYCPQQAMQWNSIELHDAMVERDDVAYCPCVYGYATYGEADVRRRLAFADFAGAVAPYHAGSAIGGTAAGVSRLSPHRDDALALVGFLLSAPVQDRLIPLHHGQAAFASSWSDADNDARFNGFFSGAACSIAAAWVRPRHPGYITFQNEAGRIVGEGLAQGRPARGVAAAVIGEAARVRTLEPSGA